MSFLRNHGRKLLIATLGIVASILFLRITQEVLFNSPEVISDDYFEWIPTVNKILSGDSKGWADCTYGSHVAIVPLLIWILNAKLLHWSLFAERLLGLLVSIGKIAIMSSFSLPLTRSKFLTLSILFAICFSMTQVTVYVYPVASTVFGLATFFFLLGLSLLDSACAKSSDSRAEQIGFIFTSVLSCLSAGILLPAFSSYLTLIAIHRRFTLLKCWLIATSISALPYLAVLLNFKKASANTFSTFNPVRILDMLGSLTTSELSQISIKSVWTYTTQGFLGMLFAGYLVYLLLKEPKLKSKNKASQDYDAATIGRSEALAISLMVFGFSSAVVLGAFRNAVSQWHVSLTSFFWIGLIFLLLEKIVSNSEQSTRETKIICTAILSFICMSLAKANFNSAPYDYTYRARNTAAETFIQQYRTTPTYNFQFLNGGECLPLSKVYKAVSIAEKNQWITFRKKILQTKGLQSSFFQPEVVVFGPDGIAGITWFKTKPQKKVLPICAEKLRFAISRETSIYWTPNYENCLIKSLEIKTKSNPTKLKVEILRENKVIQRKELTESSLNLDLDLPADSLTSIKVTALVASVIDEFAITLEKSQSKEPQSFSRLPSPNNVDRPCSKDNRKKIQLEITKDNYDYENLIEVNKSEGLKTFRITGESPKLICPD